MTTVVVTGSTRGIGFGLAESFLKHGCRVVVSGRGQEAVDEALDKLRAASDTAQVAGRACDVTNSADLEALWKFAGEQFARIDIWINNAGISINRAPLWAQSAADILAVVNTNLTGVLLASKVVMAGMREQGGGQIWNMEGFGSNGMTQPGMAAYGATKRAVNYLNKALRKDAAGTGIRVCTLSPGIVVTDLLIGDYDTSSEQWRKARRLLNILGDTVETVTPYLVEGVLHAQKDGARVMWLTNRKAAWRFLTARFKKRDLFADLGI